MSKKSFNDIKIPSKPNKDKILMKVYNPVLEEKIVEEPKINPKINPILEQNKFDFKRNKFDNSFLEENKGRNKYTIWFIALVSMVFLFFAVSFVFSKATVTINPKIKSLSFNQNIYALKDAGVGDVSFDIITLSDEESKQVIGEEKNVSIMATGKVLLYNEYSTAPQQLLIDTRLEGSNGKIYKTKTKTVIPGKTKDGTPGKISVDIYAEKPGEEYNSDPLDFKILGFKNSPKYKGFKGRSVGSITGGLLGKSKQIGDTEKTKNEKELEKTLEDKLLNKALSQIPEGFVLYKDATFFNVDSVDTSDPSTEGLITLKVKGTLRGFVFNENKITEKIVASLLPDNKDDVYVSNIKDMTISISSRNSIDFNNVKRIDFNLYGVPKVVYKIDNEKLINDLAGISKKDFSQIMATYANIESAELSVRPVWKSSVPEKGKNIKFIINYPSQ